MSVKLLGIAAGIAVFAASAAATDLKITSVTLIDAAGNATTPHLGDDTYSLKVDWQVTGKPSGTYNVRFELANNVYNWNVNTPVQSGTYAGRVSFFMPLDGAIPYRVTLDPENTAGDSDRSNNVSTGTFTPTAPTQGVEYFNPKRWSGAEKFTVSCPQKVTKLDAVLGKPTTETSQKLLSFTSTGSQSVSQPNGQPIASAQWINPVAGSYSLSTQFNVELSAVRYNFSQANPSWTALNSVPADVAQFAKPEDAVQSTSSTVTAFVRRWLPSNYRTSMKPAAAARLLFRGVVNELSFVDTTAATAVDVLNARKGNCAGMSAVYVAAMRNIGVPARLVSGWWNGNNVWHCWSEIYLPGMGWVAQDVSASDRIDATGTYAYYFGTIPDLNQRCVVQRGVTYRTADAAYNSVQVGNYAAWGTFKTWPTTSATCSLSPMVP